MKRVARRAGFTIVETMIVLAVTGLLFVAVSTSWSGRQHVSEYQTALRNTRAQLQQTVSDIENGYFPSTNNITCTESITLNLSFAAGTNDQGTNSSCVFIGKALQFNDGGGNPEQVEQYTVAGRSNSDVRTIDQVKPTLAPGMSTMLNLAPDLQTISVKDNGNNNQYNGVVFMTDPGAFDDSGVLQSGRQVVRAYGLVGHLSDVFYDVSPPSGVPSGGVPLSGGLTPKYIPITSAGLRICFKSGATKNYGILTIGAKGSATNIQSESRQGDCGP